MVIPETPAGGVEGVDRFDEVGIIESVVSEELSDTTPVFLFDVGVVVFLVGSRSGEFDFRFVVGEVSEEMIVEELGAVVTVEAFEGEGQALLDILDLLEDPGSAVVPGGPAFGPSGIDVGERQAPDKVTTQGVSAVGDGIGFHEAGLGDIPVVGADRNLIA